MAALVASGQELRQISGKVLNRRLEPIVGAMVLNSSTFAGSFAKSDGSFSISMSEKDTLVFGAYGFASKRIPFDGLAPGSPEGTIVLLDELRVEVGTVDVFAPRDLEEIYRDIEELGYNVKDYRLAGVNALESPITFLYQAFSRKERGRRLAAELENEYQTRELLKELLAKYADYEIVDLNDREFDDFIDYLGVDDVFLQQTSQYQFILFVKEQFRRFRIDQRKLKEEDFQYDNQD